MQVDDEFVDGHNVLPGAERKGGSQPGARILVVDDNEDAAMMMAAVLKAYGYEAVSAADGREALELVVRFLPAVALVDLGLPGMDGFELARRFKQLPECQEMRIVAVTGYGQDHDRRRSASAGFDAHLVKPVDTDQLTKLLREFTSSPDRV